MPNGLSPQLNLTYPKKVGYGIERITTIYYDYIRYTSDTYIHTLQYTVC